MTPFSGPESSANKWGTVTVTGVGSPHGVLGSPYIPSVSLMGALTEIV